MGQSIAAAVPEVTKTVASSTAAVASYSAALVSASGNNNQTQSVPAPATFPLELTFPITNPDTYTLTVASLDANGNVLDPGVASEPLAVAAPLTLVAAGQPTLSEQVS